MVQISLRNGRKIGKSNPCYIMLDVAANHNTDIETAKRLIKTASDCGADAVKFQTYTADKLYSKKTPQFSRDLEVPYELIKKVQHPREWLPELALFSKGCGIDFVSSPFDYEAVDLLEAIGVPFFKVASLEIVDLEFLRYIALKGKPVVLSTGMASLEEIEEALGVMYEVGNKQVVLLHCNTVYPTPPYVANLNAMDTLREVFKVPVGYSDHTLGHHITTSAVAKGAVMIEKHFTLDSKQSGPDHSFSIEPTELCKMIKEIRDIEGALGDGIKRVSAVELENYNKGRRSIIAKVSIPENTVITRDMLIVKRPGYGIKPKYINRIIGKISSKKIEEDDIITWDLFK